ncbi:MAG TPA: TraR/DksA C4-type zinc finger protein [Acidimicrobiales bacterium]|nr:TraR/DksA C4-type zinc finger protein [Acidimicrobiales bacterium]
MPSEALLADLRSQLEAERDQLRNQLAELGFADGGAGLEYDENFADSSQVTAERGEAGALAHTLQETLTDVERALEKLDGGSFGTCETCGNPIVEARLEAMPAAKHCIDCASKR